MLLQTESILVMGSIVRLLYRISVTANAIMILGIFAYGIFVFGRKFTFDMPKSSIDVVFMGDGIARIETTSCVFGSQDYMRFPTKMYSLRSSMKREMEIAIPMAVSFENLYYVLRVSISGHEPDIVILNAAWLDNKVLNNSSVSRELGALVISFGDRILNCPQFGHH